MSGANDIPDNYVKVYCLSKFSPDEVKAIKAELESPKDPGDEQPNQLDWIKAQIVPWDRDQDGSTDDLYAKWRELRDANNNPWEFAFFLDRQCVADKTVLIADKDHYTLMFSPETMQEMNDLIRKHKSSLPEWSDWLSDNMREETCDRALTYGRIPATGFRSTWANLDIANMDVVEIVEMYEGELQRLENESWDAEAFLKKAEELNERAPPKESE